MTKKTSFYWRHFGRYFLFSVIFSLFVGCSDTSTPTATPSPTVFPETPKATESPAASKDGVRQLKLDNTETSDADLKKICEENPKLAELTLGGTKVRDLDEALANLKELKKIRLSNTSLSSKALDVLAKIESLEDIDISQTSFGGPGELDRFATLPNLKRLNLYSTAISNASLNALKNFKSAEKLTWLNIDKCLLTDGALPKLAPLKNLEWLHLGRTELTDAGLVELAKLKTLKEVSVTNTKVTKEGVEKLKAALPDCKVNENVDAPKE